MIGDWKEKRWKQKWANRLSLLSSMLGSGCVPLASLTVMDSVLKVTPEPTPAAETTRPVEIGSFSGCWDWFWGMMLRLNPSGNGLLPSPPLIIINWGCLPSWDGIGGTRVEGALDRGGCGRGGSPKRSFLFMPSIAMPAKQAGNSYVSRKYLKRKKWLTIYTNPKKMW